MIGLNKRKQLLFTELKKLDLVSRYVVSHVAKGVGMLLISTSPGWS